MARRAARSGAAGAPAAGAAVVVVGSRYDNFPVTVLEAMAVGCPLVAPRVGGIPEIVEDGVNGLLYEAGNPADMAAKLVPGPGRPRPGRPAGPAGRRSIASDGMTRPSWPDEIAGFYRPGDRRRPDGARGEGDSMNEHLRLLSLFLWLPIVVGIFATQPPRRAVVVVVRRRLAVPAQASAGTCPGCPTTPR